MLITRLSILALVGMSMTAKWDRPGAPAPVGVWQITSVEREGSADTSQVGGYVTFTGDTVTFEPTLTTRNYELKPLSSAERTRLAFS